MGLKTEEITLVWSGFIKKRYVEKGYTFTKNGDEFKIKIEDIPSQSHEWIECKCDICDKTFPKQYYAYTRAFNNGGIIRCKECKSLKHKKQEPKYSYDEVKLKCESLGFELISEKTGTFKDYIKVKCINHKDIIQDKKIASIFKGSGCIYCSKENDKHPYEYVKSLFEEKNCTLLSKIYVNMNSKLDFTCNKHPFEIQSSTLTAVINHQPCKYCQTEEQSERQSFNIEFIKEEFKSKDCELITNKYINNTQPLEFICDNHKNEGIQNVTYHGLRVDGKPCKYCAYESRAQKRRKDFNLIKEDYNNAGFDLLEIESDYINNLTPMRCICREHKDVIQNITYSQIQQGHGCILCWNERKGDLYRFDYEFVRQEFADRNLILLDKTYVNNSTKMRCVCNNHPDIIQETSYSSLILVDGCKYCHYEERTGEPYQPWFARTKNISSYLRHFIGDWKIKTMEKDNFKCVISGDNNIAIHHLYPFNKIAKETISISELPVYDDLMKYTKEELQLLVDICVDLHIKYGLGVCLSKEIHIEFHKIYGKANSNRQQFEDFKTFKQLNSYIVKEAI